MLGYGTDDDEMGFWESLLDFSFTYFITQRIVAFIYGLGIAIGFLVMLALILAAVGVTIGGPATGLRPPTGGALIMALLAPLGFSIYVLALRLYLELIVVLFRIAANTRTIADKTRP